MNPIKVAGILLLALLLACPPALAKQDKGKGKGAAETVLDESGSAKGGKGKATDHSNHSKDGKSDKGTEAVKGGKGKAAEPVLSIEEQDVLRQHSGVIMAPSSSGQEAALPPGLTKKAAKGKPLPPGWQKKLARGQVMDQDVYAHAVMLPPNVIRLLPPPPPGTILVQVEGKVVRLAQATMTILDVFDLLP